jgi:glycerate kinase
MKIVVAIDSFKGSLTSTEAGQAAIDCIQSLFPNCQTELIPIADGGEGMLTVMMSTTQGHIQSL